MNFNQMGNLFAQYKKIVIVGMGNCCCSDDCAGLIFWEKLQQVIKDEKVIFVNAGCNPENHLMQIIETEPELVLFTDAVEDRQSQGIKIYNSDEIDDKDFSTHAYSIGFIEKFIKMNIDADVKYLGINIQNSSVGDMVSSEVQNEIEKYFKNIVY